MEDSAEVYSYSKYRLSPIPNENWIWYQEWNNAVFLHWQVSLDLIRNLVPQMLEIDTFDGQAWVSAVAFDMNKVRRKNIPYIKEIGNFSEFNIRTYVSYKNEPGVYFLSIDACKIMPVYIARLLSGLNYEYSNINRQIISENQQSFSLLNASQHKKIIIDYEIAQEINNKSKLDIWLTERYKLYKFSKKELFSNVVHHIEWQVNQIKLNRLEIDYKKYNYLFNGKPTKTHFSPEVKVIAWKTRKEN